VIARPMKNGVQPAVEPPSEVTIYIGGVHASGEPVIVRTLLGSCIAVCLWDRERGVGGMNHFLLPSGDPTGGDPARFGVHAMDRLIGAMMKLGADRRRFVAKIFGGAHVLNIAESAQGVPQRNIAFTREFLEHDHIPIAAEDVGGYQPRDVRFYTATNRVRVRRVGATRAQARLARTEQRADTAGPSFGTIELWD
jgi:chemotaxis receptor (MCP) glutamine deamidase CheD